MNVLTASAPSHLKLALHTTKNNEFSEAPDYAYLEISALQAQAVIYLVSLTRQFGLGTAESGLVERCYDVSLGLGRRLPIFRLLHLPFAESGEPSSDQPTVALPDDFDPDALGEHAEHRVECHRIKVGPTSVRFSALSKHGDDRFVTTSLSEELLQMIANDYPTGLPAARLEHRNAWA